MDALERQTGEHAVGIHLTAKPGLGHNVVAVKEDGVKSPFELMIMPERGRPDPSLGELVRGERTARFYDRRGESWEQAFGGYVNLDARAATKAGVMTRRMLRETRETYSFISHACTTDAIRVVEATGLRAPPWAYSPTTSSLWMRLLPNRPGAVAP
jgi:hypothetical protein